jgi:transcriptional regulator GlxA family with amidase domain
MIQTDSGRTATVRRLVRPGRGRFNRGMTTSTAPLRIGMLLFDEVEVLDACGPFEVFSVANRAATASGHPAPFALTLFATATPVVARGGLRLLRDHGLDDDAGVDVLIVPGGVVDAVERDTSVLAWVARTAAHAAVVASVCTGTFVLAAAGLLDHRPVTTHWEDVDELRRRYPALDVRVGPRFLDHGDLATSGGISAGLDLSLHLVGRLAHPGLAARTARQMDYVRVRAPVSGSQALGPPAA